LQRADFCIGSHVVESEQYLSGFDVIAILREDGFNDPTLLVHDGLAFAVVSHDALRDDST
jgi:hypothetical protein